MVKSRNLLIAIALILGVSAALAQTPLTPFFNLRVKTDTTGALYVTNAAAVAPDTPLTAMSNLRGKTDSNGALYVTCTGCSGGGGMTTGTYAALPAAGTAGRQYYFTDSVYDFAYDNGSSWEYYLDGRRMYDPNLQSWSWVNQGTAAVSTASGGIRLTAGIGAISDNVHLYVKTAPSAPYTITLAFKGDYYSVDYMEYMAGWRNSAAGFIVAGSGSKTWAFGDQNRYLIFAKWTNPTTISAAYPNTAFVSKILGDGEVRWFQLVDDNTNRKWNISYDKGVTWNTIYSTLRTDFITPNQLWFGFNQYNSAQPYSMTLLSWREQ